MEWFHDVSNLLQQTDKVYERLVALDKPDKLTLTKEKIYSERSWESVKSLIEPNFEAELSKLKFFYIPKVFQPGPCFVFPLFDVENLPKRAQTRPMEGSILFNEKNKYYMLGDKDQFLGPSWIGNDVDTIQKLLETQSIILVEGGFDLLACRLLAPELPIMSTTTNKVGKKHVLWLKMLGVKNIYLLFDNERSDKGNQAMNFLQRDLKEFNVEIILQAGAEDPSSSLHSMISARKFRTLLKGIL